ncbi:zinc finger BED domain-containing protein RICESLEEPER 2-like [Humulus lupulus]|uniref:zinc finger BED domain-containing protein RICESLEEPER 2-like n=1 Tax=Humulus lupulus TaxID=3486 RepID=UPI002B406A83|nr:zinc finger BED domain-containing protein RICESLEEPER 2-like [Humulus lupulus]
MVKKKVKGKNNKEEKEEDRAKCNYCGADYAADSKYCGTSTLWSHVEKKCRKCPFSDWVEQNKKQTMITQFTKKTPDSEVNSSGTTTMKFSQNKVRELISKYFIIDELSFRHIEGKGFRLLVTHFFPNFDFLSRYTIARDIYQLFLEEKKKLRNEFVNRRLSLHTDCWTSIQNISYMCLTAHWIDDNWKMQKRIISFIQVPSHKGDMVAKELIICLNHWGITQLFSITVDNASSNDVALRKVKEYLSEKPNALVLGGEMFHMRCCAHILNLVVSDGLKEMSYAISSIRNAVRYVRSSPARLKRFKEACKDVNVESKALLCLDVVTRWNSTYMMLEAALKFKKAFRYLEGDANYTKYFEKERVNGEKFDGPPDNIDWTNAEVFVKFLKAFYELTLKFSGSLYVTSNLFFQEILEVQVELNDMKSSTDELMSKMAGSMQLKFDKYWGNVEKINLLQYIASILDPRFKLDVVLNSFRYLYDPILAEKMIKKVENMMTTLYAFYKGTVMTPSSSNDQQASESVTSNASGSSSSSSFLIKRRFISSEVTSNDLDDYYADRKEKLVEATNFDILDWWQRNGNKYPIVSHIARDVLAIQMSTVASE